MDNQKDKSEILFKASGKGYSIVIRGRKKPDGSWECAVEENEVQLTEIPNAEHVASLGEKREYHKSDFRYSFIEAFNNITQTEWFLCRPDKIHADFSEFLICEFERKMKEYNEDFPADSPMDEFLRSSRTKEWKDKASQTS